jgi:putative addiction module antidote
VRLINTHPGLLCCELQRKDDCTTIIYPQEESLEVSDEEPSRKKRERQVSSRLWCWYLRTNRRNHADPQTNNHWQLIGVVLPKEALAKLHLEKGDPVCLTESPDGFRLTPYSPEFAKQMLAARKIMEKWRAVLCELAKCWRSSGSHCDDHVTTCPPSLNRITAETVK